MQTHSGLRAEEEDLVEQEVQRRRKHPEAVGVHFGGVGFRPVLHRRGRHGPARKRHNRQDSAGLAGAQRQHDLQPSLLAVLLQRLQAEAHAPQRQWQLEV